MRRSCELFVIVNRSIRGGILHECAKKSGASFQLAGFSSQVGNLRHVEVKSLEISHYDLNPEWFCASPHHFDGLRMTIVSDEKSVARAIGGGVMTQGHGLGGGRRFIEQGGIGDVESGEVGHHGLEIDQRFETTLGKLGLIRGVSGIPTRVFEDVPLNYRWCDGVGIPSADEIARDSVL